MDYVGNAATSIYSYNFRIFENSDLTVTVRSTDGTESLLTLTTDYTVSGAGDLSGGSVTLVNASQSWLTAGNLKTDYTLTIRRILDLEQGTDLRNQGTYYPESVEDEFDRGVMIAQQQQDDINRSVKLPESISSSDFDPTLPSDLADNIGAAVVVNPAGTGFTLSPASPVTDAARVAKVGDTMTGDLTFNVQKGTKYGDANSSNFITVRAPATVPVDYVLELPGSAPTTSNKFLRYDGSVYSWAYPVGIVSAKSGNYTVLDTDAIQFILVTSGSSNRTITLPTANDNLNRVLTIKKVDSGVGTVILDGEGAETIDGVATKTLRQQYESITIWCDATAWHVVDRQGIITPWVAYTPTGAFVTNSTYAGFWRRNGDEMEVRASITFAGAPNSVSGTITIPSGFTMDTSKMPGITTDRSFGSVIFLDAGVRAYSAGIITYNNATTLLLYASTADATYVYETVATQAVPFTIGNTDVFLIEFKVPITEFAF